MDKENKETKLVITDPSRLLMSDVLKGHVPDMESDSGLSEMASNYVLVILDRVINGVDNKPISGILEGFMVRSDELEVEVKITLDDALDLIEPGIEVTFNSCQLHSGERVIEHVPPHPRPCYTLGGVRFSSIDYRHRMCVVILNLRF